MNPDIGKSRSNPDTAPRHVQIDQRLASLPTADDVGIVFYLRHRLQSGNGRVTQRGEEGLAILGFRDRERALLPVNVGPLGIQQLSPA
jgi:hypothetical protein